MNSIGVYPTAEEIDLFVTRYDRTHDGRLSFSEFSEAFLALDSYFAQMVNRRNANTCKKPLYRRDDCFLADTQIEFRSMWRSHFKIECASETLRQKLHARPMFTVEDAFSSLDINQDGRITVEELKRLVQSRGYFVSDKDVLQVIDKMDKNKDGTVHFNEFREELLPKSANRRA